MKKIEILQYNIPFRLCFTGPGASLILTQSAPKEMVIPVSVFPNWAHTTAGKTISSAIRIPSARYW
ncbi:MAG: hypothetical protein ACRDE5_04815, partial [Ginsengibacter sp.]